MTTYIVLSTLVSLHLYGAYRAYIRVRASHAYHRAKWLTQGCPAAAAVYRWTTTERNGHIIMALVGGLISWWATSSVYEIADPAETPESSW